MKSASTDSDGSEKNLRPREIARNCGQLLGRLDALLPCFYIAHYGAFGRELRARKTAEGQGLFAVAARNDGDRPSVTPHVGLILPLDSCRDESVRTVLQDIPALIDGSRSTTMSERRSAVQAKLDEAFSGDLTIADNESMGGFFALQPGPGLFNRLEALFDYVTEVIDNPVGDVRITGSARFCWRSYGELMEWYHGLRGLGRFERWSALTPYFVCGNTASLPSYSTDRWARAGLRRPAEEPSRWFMIRPGLPDGQIAVRLKMEEYGWAKLRLTLDATEITIHLSNVFDPFPELVAWGREIAEGDLPIEMEIDEEGHEAVLTVLRTDDAERVLLRVTRRYENEILLEGLVGRVALAAALKAEMVRFFNTEFDPLHWDEGRENEHEDGYVSIRDRMLSHTWLMSPK